MSAVSIAAQRAVPDIPRDRLSLRNKCWLPGETAE